MHKVTVRLPATITGLGPGISAPGLAIGLYATVEITERNDNQLIVDTEGEGAGHYSIGLRHPVTLAIMRVFQRLEHTAPGVHIRVNSGIPVESGLGAEAAFWVAGIIGANNLLGQGLSREEILQLSARITPEPDNAIAALLGGLTSGVTDQDTFIYRSLPVTPVQLVIVTPSVEDYPASIEPLPDPIPLDDVRYNINRLPLLLEGLRSGDLGLISQVLDDRIHNPRLHVPGYNHVRETARLAGALAVTICGDGPSLVAFAKGNQERIAEAMVAAFQNAGIDSQSWVVPIDTQGVVISAMQSA